MRLLSSQHMVVFFEEGARNRLVELISITYALSASLSGKAEQYAASDSNDSIEFKH